MTEIRSTIQTVNTRIDEYLGVPERDRLETYERILSNVDATSALHFGSGRDKNGIATRLEANGSDVVALDPDDDGLERNSIPRKVRGDGQRLPFADDSFDLVFSEYVFEHLPDPNAALREIDRVLRPGGSFVVLVPNPRHYYARIADLTPFWFHRLWFALQGVESAEDDRFPTQYEWGTYSDVYDAKFDWTLAAFHSFPGPTGYTKILPVHFLFTLFDRAMVDRPRYHVAFVAHYRKSGQRDGTGPTVPSTATSPERDD